MHDKMTVGGVFHVDCRDSAGWLKWTATAPNLVTTAGLQHLLDVLFAGSTQVNPWYVGLTDGTPTVDAGDTVASHAGWAEVVAYDEATRQTYTDVRSSQTVSNAASKAVFTVSTNATTIGGAFLASDSTRGGSTGTLLCAAAFTGGDKTADDGDTLSVTYTFTAADDGV